MHGGKNKWVLVLLVFSGIVIGGFIGEYVAKLPYMGWLAYGQSFGFDEPFSLDLNIIKLQFAFMVKITIAGIIGIVISIFAYRRL